MDSTIEQGPVVAAPAQPQPRLQRNALSLFETVASTLANMAPAEGIFVAIGLTVSFMGSRAPWAFLLAMIAVFTCANTMSEFSRARPSAGSFVSFIANGIQGYAPRAALFVSTTCFVILMLGYIISTASAVVFLGAWVQVLVPSLNWMVISVVALLIVVPLLLRGVAVSTILSFVMFLIEAVALSFLAVAILFLAHGHITAPFTNAGGMPGFSGLALAFPIVVLGFVGWDNSGALAEETKQPRRTVPITVFVSVFIVGMVYFLSSYSMIVGFAGLKLKDPLGALSVDPSPFLTVARNYLPWFLAVLGLVGVTSSAGYYIASATSQTRIIFHSGREGLLPAFFARVTTGAKPVPYVAVLSYILLSLALIVLPGIWLNANDVFTYEATIGTVPVVLIYLLANVALPLYFWKYQRSAFNWFKHIVVPLIGVAVLALPIWGFFAPNQPTPYNYFGWIFAGLLILSAAWGGYVFLKRRDAVKYLGSIVADE
ncbi:MAG: APC family permease [Ktedonobacteraceae bacterium]|nr:APC family permease [Ktedonobacteraceae bacterium]